MKPLLLALFLFPFSVQSNTDCSIDDEYLIYLKLLSEGKPKPVIIENKTSLGWQSVIYDNVSPDDIIEHLRLDKPRIKIAEARKRFLYVNKEPNAINECFSQNNDVIVIDSINMYRLLIEHTVMDLAEHYQKIHSTESCIYSISGVGFDDDFTLAVLYSESNCSIESGGGMLYVLEKINNKWKVTYMQQMWVA